MTAQFGLDALVPNLDDSYGKLGAYSPPARWQYELGYDAADADADLDYSYGKLRAYDPYNDVLEDVYEVAAMLSDDHSYHLEVDDAHNSLALSCGRPNHCVECPRVATGRTCLMDAALYWAGESAPIGLERALTREVDCVHALWRKHQVVIDHARNVLGSSRSLLRQLAAPLVDRMNDCREGARTEAAARDGDDYDHDESEQDDDYNDYTYYPYYIYEILPSPSTPSLAGAGSHEAASYTVLHDAEADSDEADYEDHGGWSSVINDGTYKYAYADGVKLWWYVHDDDDGTYEYVYADMLSWFAYDDSYGEAGPTYDGSARYYDDDDGFHAFGDAGDAPYDAGACTRSAVGCLSRGRRSDGDALANATVAACAPAVAAVAQRRGIEGRAAARDFRQAVLVTCGSPAAMRIARIDGNECFLVSLLLFTAGYALIAAACLFCGRRSARTASETRVQGVASVVAIRKVPPTAV